MDLKKDDLQILMDEIAREMALDVDAVAIEKFAPVPSGDTQRSLFYETFGKIEVYIFDPNAIALSKTVRGFDMDIDDVVFLIQRGWIDLNELERLAHESLPRASEFDLDPNEILAHLRAIRQRIQ